MSEKRWYSSLLFILSFLTIFIYPQATLTCLAAAPGEPVPESAVSASPSPASCGALHVEGTQLMDSQGNPVRLKGLSTHGLAWFPGYVNEDCFRQLRTEWNANVIRLAMYTAESGGYCTDGDQEYLRQLIRDGVSFAADQDLYVIIDWHILSDSDPNTYRDEAIAFFSDISAEFAAYDNILYEICNEPNNGTTWEAIRAYALEVIPAIRANDPDSVILIGTPNWSQYVDQAAADPITEYDNLMYTLHFYAATHTDSLRSTLSTAVDAGLPVFVSEYGICDASGNGAIDEAQANTWMELLDRYQISSVAWNLSNKTESSAILKSACQKTSGFTADDLSDSGKWLYQMLTGAKSPEPPSDSSNDSAAAGDSDSNDSAAAGDSDSISLSGELEGTLNLMDSWESNGQSFFRYDLALTNTTEKNLNSWQVTLSFNDSFSLSDGWNGSYSCDSRILTVTPMDYNKSVPAGGTVTDIGFIVSGADGLAVVSLSTETGQ